MLLLCVCRHSIWMLFSFVFFFFSSRRRHTRFDCDWSSDVCSSDLTVLTVAKVAAIIAVAGGTFAFSDVHDWSNLAAPSGSARDRKSTRLNSSHSQISYAVFCLKKKKISSPCTCAYVQRSLVHQRFI